MPENFLQLRAIYVDKPDLIEIGVRVVHGEWSAVALTAMSRPAPRITRAAPVI